MPRVKKRKPLPFKVHEGQPKARRLLFKDLIAARLGEARPLTHNGRIKQEFRSAADEICHHLMEDARAGKLQAIKLLVECTEGAIIRQDTVNYIIERIYNAITQFVSDEETLFKIGHALFKLKHTVGPNSPSRYRNPTYSSPSQLDSSYHAEPKIQQQLALHQQSRADRLALLSTIPERATNSRQKTARSRT